MTNTDMRYIVALLAVLAAGPSAAQIATTGAGKVGGVAYTGPGDIVSGATAAYSLRAWTAAIAMAATQKLTNLRRASDNHTCDFIVTTAGGVGNSANCSTGGDNGQSASSFCNATSCFSTKVYDQSGNANDQSQATAANQVGITFSCLGSSTCFSNGSGANHGWSASIGTQAQPLTFYFVGDRTGNTSAFNEVMSSNLSNMSLGFNNTTNTAYIASSTAKTATASDNAWHVIQGVFNGASSVINIDGSGSTVSPGTVGVATALGLNCNQSCALGLAGNTMEYGYWASAVSSGNQTSLCHNAFVYWGTSTSC